MRHNILIFKRILNSDGGICFDYRINIPKGYEVFGMGGNHKNLRITIRPAEKKRKEYEK